NRAWMSGRSNSSDSNAKNRTCSRAASTAKTDARMTTRAVWQVAYPGRVTVTAPPVLDAATWSSRAAAHTERADGFTAGRRERRSRQQKHAIEDFLVEYYPVSPAALRRWHPGVGVGLEAPAPHAGWRWYREAAGVVELDAAAFVAERGDA